jgi:tetratricopeptide (TPR) repeat protein
MTTNTPTIPAPVQTPPHVVARRRIFLFRLIALMLPVLYFVSLEGGLRLFNYGDNLDLFIRPPIGFSDKELLMVNPDVAKRYFTKGAFSPRPINDFLARQKPANGYRIFVMGESTTAAFPYPTNVVFSRILNQRLADAFPDKHIEVVNVAISAINSYTLLDFMDEILAQQPDAILIYAGHNEFYGALGVSSTESLGKFRPLVLLYMSLQRLKTVELLESGITQLRRRAGGLLHGQTAGGNYGTLMGRMIGDTSVPYGSPDYEIAKRQFQSNLRDIFEKARGAGVPVVISELVSNLRDHAPFVSVRSGATLDADIVYRQAQMLEADGKYDLARAAYYQAKDLDALRFRASEEFNGIIHRIAAQFNAPVVPMKAYFEAASPHGLIGTNLMLEHLHPNVDGQFIMSEAFFDILRQQGMIAAKWNEGRIEPPAFYHERWPISEFDRTLGALRIRYLTDHWPFRPLALSGQGIASFQPDSPVETFAYKVEKGEMSYMDGHLEMAKYYESRGQHKTALREYQSLVAAYPCDYKVMLTAAERLIESKQLESAMPFLYGSLNWKETAYANMWIGRLHLNNKKPQQALPFLEKAAAMQDDDPRLLCDLIGVYVLNGQLDKARDTIARLEKIKGNFPCVALLKQQLDAMQSKSRH